MTKKFLKGSGKKKKKMEAKWKKKNNNKKKQQQKKQALKLALQQMGKVEARNWLIDTLEIVSYLAHR